MISIQAGTQALCSVAVAVAAKEHPAHPVCFPTPPIYWEDSCSRLVVLLLAAKTMPSSNRSSLSCRNASPTTMYTMLSGLLHSVTAPPLQSWASMAGMLLWYHRPPPPPSVIPSHPKRSAGPSRGCQRGAYSVQYLTPERRASISLWTSGTVQVMSTP